MINRAYIVSDGSTGDIIAPVSVARELKDKGFAIFGVFDESARNLLEHMGFSPELERGSIQCAPVNYSTILQEANMAGSIRGTLTFLSVVAGMLNRTIPTLLTTWAELLSSLEKANDLDSEHSVVIGNDLGATWVAPLISLFLGKELIINRFISHNSHPWSPGKHEFRFHVTPHFILPEFLPPALVNRIFRQVVNIQYARIGERFAYQYATNHGRSTEDIAEFKKIIDAVFRHYTFEPLVIAEKEQRRQARLTNPVSIGGYAFDNQEQLVHPALSDFLTESAGNGKKIITITLGSLTGNPSNQITVLDRLIRCCLARQDVNVVLVGGYALPFLDDLAERVGGRVQLSEYENYIPLFSRSDLVFISGAAGTFHHAIVTGTPSIPIPTLPDQKTNAVWLLKEGLSPGYIPYFRMLNANRAVETELRDLINAALDEERFALRGKEVAENTERHGLDRAVAFTLKIVRTIEDGVG